ncbi:MAG: ice-binding family protein [bacterium]|nr:ice-binding family protein [bacterium]
MTPGIYKSPAQMGITGTLTLNGSATDVWIFQAGSTLTTAGASSVTLTGGAQACNVFWQVGSSATLGSASFLKGNILALTSATLGTTANVEGRVLAQNGAVTLDGSNIITKATCVVPPPAPAASTGGGSSFAPRPLINVTKIPSPLSLLAGPGLVTYTYVATNIGPVTMIGPWVKDDKCSPVTYVSGDTNKNGKLSVGEAWTYTCSKIVSQTETNTATAHGQANGWDTYDTANATVFVGVPLAPPLIHLVKTPNTFLLPFGGGAVTYSYAVTNPGTAPLSDVSIVDDKCTGLPGRVSGHPGDLNKNNLLESNETWQFTCLTNLTQTTTNIGTAEGHANGLTAIDFSPATVVVSPVKLPNTGFAPENKNLLNILVSAGIVALFASLYIARRKRVI